MELLLIRHGETPGNAERRYVGVLDQPLSARGRAQAREAGVHPGVPLVYVSTMRRAQETARIMFPNARQVQVPGVQEMDFGIFAGRTADEMADDADYRAWVDGDCQGRCPGGESREEFDTRICGAMEAFCRGLRERGEEHAILVAHGGTMMAALHRMAAERRGYYEWLTGNCGGYRMEVAFPERADAPGGLGGCESPVEFRNIREWGIATQHGREAGPFGGNA